MDKYPRTHLGVVWMIAVLFALASFPAAAQARNTGSNSGQAVLRIRINIVPVLISPPPPVEAKVPLIGSVSYNVSTTLSGTETIEETHPFVSSALWRGPDTKGAVLKTLTVVPR